MLSLGVYRMLSSTSFSSCSVRCFRAPKSPPAPGARKAAISSSSAAESLALLASSPRRKPRLLATASSISSLHNRLFMHRSRPAAAFCTSGGPLSVSWRKKSKIAPLNRVDACSCRAISGASSSGGSSIASKSCSISGVTVWLLAGSSL